ncbi:hypothetical protein IQ264_30515 [Phormidium sp. LEGE 05292]|uniref:hypothetical protein n=1 Tax=[Phormidium] sp. LEGE 05292 TaxID=767427 RepID=UPI001881E97A|nr:hypothetical protein [Phormidium sp. LEGE 05292]MBE9229740.1 hypothetical protein [Phormidium sp. LEGE 05292]
MDTVTVTFTLADWITKGLADGNYERIGGVIREVGSKQVVAWLREAGLITSNLPLPADPVTGVLNLIVSGANTAISAKGFSDVKQQLGGIEKQLGLVGKGLQQVEGALQVTTALSMLNLGVSVMGFAVINQRLNELEQRLKKAEELLKKIDRKIDLGFYAKFRAAINLAINAFTMSKAENRRSSALSAISLFLEAEHIYTDYTETELAQKSQIADEYLLTLSLAYLAEARCYLELEEHDTALSRFQEGAKVVRSFIQQYVDLLLTTNPAAYLQPQFKDQIDLRRLTRIYQWIDPNLDENALFELQRENLFKLAQNPNKWVESLPPAILTRIEVKGGLFGPNQGELKQEADKRLPQVLEVIESMVETNRRFESYQTEIQAIRQLGISFHDWLKLTPANEDKPEGAELMFIVPKKPLELVTAS